MSTIKKMLNSNNTSTCPHNIMYFGPLTAEIGWRVWGTPSNFNGFRVLASLLHRRRSTEVNQTSHDVWPSPGWYTIYTISGSCPPNGILTRAKFTLRPSLEFFHIGSVTARHSSSGRAAIALGIGPHSSYYYTTIILVASKVSLDLYSALS